MSAKCQLYRHFSKDGQLLYVGITDCESRRRAQHKIEAKWFGEIANVEVVEFASRELAAAAERAAIETERPIFNIESRRAISEKPEARRKRDERDRYRAAGLVAVQVWIRPKHRERLARYVERLNRDTNL